MKTDNGLAIAFFAVVMGSAVALAIASDIAAPACEVARSASKAVEKPFIGCIEFWLERYQGLIGGLLALAGATATIGVMRWQTDATRRSAEQGARAYAYGKLKSYLVSAFAWADTYWLGRTDIEGERIPTLDLGTDFSTLANLPPTMSKELLRLYVQTRGIRANYDQLRLMSAPRPYRYVIAAVSRQILHADDVCRALAEPIGLYEPPFEERTRNSLVEEARPYDHAPTFEDVADWLFHR